MEETQMGDDTFKMVPNSEIPTILNILENNLTHNFLLHQYISIMVHGIVNKSEIRQILLCSGGYENGVYLIKTRFQYVEDLSFFFVYALGINDLLLLKRALMGTNFIPWENSARYVFEVTLSRFTQTVCEVFIAKRLQFFVQHYILMWLPSTVNVIAKEIPENVSLSNLNESHIDEIDRQWPSFRNQKEVLKSELSYLFGIGVFRNCDKKMLSYALCFHSGGIFMLYSDVDVRRKGLGSIVIRNTIFEIRQRGWTPFCTIFPDNSPSLNLFKKIGFIEYSNADFIFPIRFV